MSKKAKREKRSLNLEQLHAVFASAREECTDRGSVSALAHKLQQGKFKKKLTEGMVEYLTALGLNQALREFLKHYANDDAEEAASQAQLNLWPAPLQQDVHDVNRARVFVPSRNMFVPLDPKHITAAEVREASIYMEKKAAETSRRADALMRLAERWEAWAEGKLDSKTKQSDLQSQR